jgi:alkylation response protein AidB-like acyl-CoA dehydrogenase
MSTPTTTDSADFYALEGPLDDDEQLATRELPFEIVPGFRHLGLAGLPCHGSGCPGGSFLLDGMVAMELARTDPSLATFSGVHGLPWFSTTKLEDKIALRIVQNAVITLEDVRVDEADRLALGYAVSHEQFGRAITGVSAFV